MPKTPTDTGGPTGQIRAHRKSKNGCQQCKQAKIKCDEQKPICSHCKRFKSQCSFLDQPLSVESSSDTGTKQSTPTPLSGLSSAGYDTVFTTLDLWEGLPGTTSTGLQVHDFELLHFYTTTTSLTLSERPELQRIWQQVVPQIAFTNHFLLHGLLAFSALHLARQQPDRQALLYSQAAAHHDLGLRMFQTAMTNITPQNCDACFAFSSIIAAYAWASSSQTGDLFFSEPSVSEEDGNVEWASLLRGVHILLRVAGEWVTRGSMEPVLRPRIISPEEARVADPEMSAKLMALSSLWISSPGIFANDEVETLNETLSVLHECCGLVALSRVDPEIDLIKVVYGWPIQVPESFVAMVKEQRPAALIVLAHYSLLLNKVNKMWYMQGMSRRLLQTIHGKIGKDWESWIAWPMQDLVLTEFKDQVEG